MLIILGFTMEQETLMVIQKLMAAAQFDLNGKIIDANKNFLNLMGYRKSELIGKYHCIFVDERYKNGRGYRDFWNSLCQGNIVSSEFKRLKGDNSEIWLHAIYYPIKSCEGKITSIIKVATEISNMKAKYYDNYLLFKKLDAIDARIPIIEFSTDGTIVSANQSYLNMFGYELNEVLNKKHSMFVPEHEHDSEEYRDFWDMLASSQICEGDFVRVGKNGKKVNLKATYYPLIDENGHCIRILKIAKHVDQKSEKTEGDEEIKELLSECIKSIRDNVDRVSMLLDA